MPSDPVVSIIFPYYENPEMLAYQLSHYAACEPSIRDAIEIIVVDDASPNSPARDVIPDDYPVALSVYAITNDKPWNQDAARNIGAHEARGEYLLLTDVDHIAPVSTLRGLMDVASPTRVVTMGRKAHFSDVIKPSHVNSYFLAKALFWDSGGYDEDFWGTYGSDRIFREHLRRRYPIDLYDDLKLELVTQGSIPDAKNTAFSRRPSALRKVRGVTLRLLKALGFIPFPRTMVNPYVRHR